MGCLSFGPGNIIAAKSILPGTKTDIPAISIQGLSYLCSPINVLPMWTFKMWVCEMTYT